ncbi:MAG: HAD-IIIA family hydrolase [Oligoflexia bacterium]|nr:HAD-IIIA family hydrolase [Oligoflexia bacterium]
MDLSSSNISNNSNNNTSPLSLRAVFLDRDGVINLPIIKNNLPFSPGNLNEFIFCDGIVETIREIKNRNYLVIVVTNQPDVARGIKVKDEIEKIHQYIKKHTLVDEIYCCYHDNKDNCDCRKPKVGLFLQAQQHFSSQRSQCSQCSQINFNESYMVGDRKSDMLVGRKLFLKNIFINYNYHEPAPSITDYDYIIETTNANTNTNHLKQILNFVI